MDPIEVIELCRKAAHEGAPKDIPVPRLFNAGYYQDLWKRDPRGVRRLLDDLLCAPHPGDGLELLYRFDVIYALFPELVAIRDLGDADGMHKDVWTHTKSVVAGVPNQLELRWGALLHDIGKARTRRIISGRVTFHNHDLVGARMVDSMQSRTNLFQDDVALLRTVRHLVLHHLRPAGYKSTWSDSAVRRLVTECGDPGFFQKLMALSRADLTTKVPAKRARALLRGRELEERAKSIMAESEAPKLPKGTMGVIIEKAGRKPGAWLQELREWLEDSMMVGSLDVDRDVGYYVDAGLQHLGESPAKEG